jgi:hypothetical protein
MGFLATMNGTASPASLKCASFLLRVQLARWRWLPAELIRLPLGSSWKRASTPAMAGWDRAACAYMADGWKTDAGSSCMRVRARSPSATNRVSALAMGSPSSTWSELASRATCVRGMVGSLRYAEMSVRKMLYESMNSPRAMSRVANRPREQGSDGALTAW